MQHILLFFATKVMKLIENYVLTIIKLLKNPISSHFFGLFGNDAFREKNNGD
jgi:hypothetical protein